MLKMPGATLVGVSDGVAFPVTILKLEPGDSILLFTDGIPEATNPGGIMFGTERTRNTLNREHHVSMNGLVHALKATVEKFVKTAPQYDDYTLFALRYLG